MLRLLLLCALTAVAVGTNTNLQNPGTHYHIDGKAVYFQVYRVQNVLQYNLQGANAASPGGEVGFLTEEYSGGSAGFIMRDCVQMHLPHNITAADLLEGDNQAFSSYNCCSGGSCSNCGYQGSGTNSEPLLPGRSFALDIPNIMNAVMSPKYGWWYSFQPDGMCKDNATLGVDCFWRAARHVQVVKYSDINSNSKWTKSITTQQEFDDDVALLRGAFDEPAVESYMEHNGKYKMLDGHYYADPAMQCQSHCPPGTTSPTGLMDPFSTAAQPPCVKCPIGQYSAAAGSTSCSSCPSGQTTYADGAASAAACYDPSTPACAAGTTSISRHEPCTACPAGTYQDRTQQSSCTPCPKYTASTISGADDVSACVLAPPKAFWVYSYDSGKSAESLSGEVGADEFGFINYMQGGQSPVSVSSASGTVSRRCVETVNAKFAPNTCYGWESWCQSQFNQGCTKPICALITGGASSNSGAPYSNTGSNNGEWYYFPDDGQCSGSTQLPGDKCTWKAATVFESVPLKRLHEDGLYLCPVDNAANEWECGDQLSPGQWKNSTDALNSWEARAKLTTLKGHTPHDVGGISIQNGRCHVECPKGFKFQSAFVEPYCVPDGSPSASPSPPPTSSNSSSFMADDPTGTTSSNSLASILGFSFAGSVLIIGAVVAAVRLSRRRRGFANLDGGHPMGTL